MEISPEETAEALKSGSIKLLDVRNQVEFDTARIEGATLVTEELVLEMVDSWDKATPIVLYCHHGVRSLGATQFLLAKGFESVRSMAGGIDAWSQIVDPGVPRY